MLKRLIILFLFSVTLPYLSIENGSVYDNQSKKYYSHDQFIEFMSSDSTFLESKDYNQYVKYHNRLSFKKSWYISFFLIGSIGAGLEGIQHPERWKEGGENYDPGERNKPPGVDNIVFGTLVYTGYFGYNQYKRDGSLIKILNEYNTSKFFYSDIDVPYIKNNSKKRFDLRYQVGLFSEKTPFSLASVSINYDINNSYEIFTGLGASLSLFFIAGSISLGGKYYFNNKKISPYFTFSAYNSLVASSSIYNNLRSGDYQGLNLSFGLTYNKRINLGIASYIQADKTYFTPVLNIEI